MFYKFFNATILNIFLTGVFLGLAQLELTFITIAKLSSSIIWYFMLLCIWLLASLLGTYFEQYMIAKLPILANFKYLKAIMLLICIVLNIYCFNFDFNFNYTYSGLILLAVLANGFYAGSFLASQYQKKLSLNILLCENNGFILGYIIGYLMLFFAQPFYVFMVLTIGLILLNWLIQKSSTCMLAVK